MCIRDRYGPVRGKPAVLLFHRDAVGPEIGDGLSANMLRICLLYTSDAADERSSVDLGGRRIIKKKKIEDQHAPTHINNNTIDTHMTQRHGIA